MALPCVPGSPRAHYIDKVELELVVILRSLPPKYHHICSDQLLFVPINTWTNKLNRQFSKEEAETVNKHWKKHKVFSSLSHQETSDSIQHHPTQNGYPLGKQINNKGS